MFWRWGSQIVTHCYYYIKYIWGSQTRKSIPVWRFLLLLATYVCNNVGHTNLIKFKYYALANFTRLNQRESHRPDVWPCSFLPVRVSVPIGCGIFQAPHTSRFDVTCGRQFWRFLWFVRFFRGLGPLRGLGFRAPHTSRFDVISSLWFS